MQGTPDTIEVPDPSDPEAAFASVVALRRLADRLELATVNVAVRQGWSWTDVAAALGVSRQAAHKKFARRVERPDTRPRRD
ncbi:MAG TPA: helix-turn-helix transcriptional regulator [Acidimicrobiales bacterium]|nr:helix-turn-helix transcriptional regulator [Acidimicrobiales bacterium]